MNTSYPPQPAAKTMWKAFVTGFLILVLLIPTLFIMHLVEEREQRQQQVISEVSAKWGSHQTFSGPYLFVPYTEALAGADGNKVVVTKWMIVLPETLQVKGTMLPHERTRSIYKVLLYRASVQAQGQFVPALPAGLPAGNVLWQQAKLCVGITDIKGLEESVRINVNGNAYPMSPGLPVTNIDSFGLSCALPLHNGMPLKPIRFEVQVKIKGTGNLQFVPLGGNSTFTLSSPWPSPAFDGYTLPVNHQVTGKGFTASWQYNQANLPFGTVLKDAGFDKRKFAFGVNMVQPADHYAKTMRSVKYAILFIGLTFSLFFIVELMQKKPMHPVQYVLVGLALVIFFTLLLSLSEYLPFNAAYLVASAATIGLITLYAHSHFARWSVAGVFGLVLSMLYAFIFVLIQLEDTALLVGSIGLFVVLALVMYASRNVQWYGSSTNPPAGSNAV